MFSILKWTRGHDSKIDELISQNRYAAVTRSGRGKAEWAKADKNKINLIGKAKFEDVIRAQEAHVRAERLARNLEERRLRIVG